MYFFFRCFQSLFVKAVKQYNYLPFIKTEKNPINIIQNSNPTFFKIQNYIF